MLFYLIINAKSAPILSCCENYSSKKHNCANFVKKSDIANRLRAQTKMRTDKDVYDFVVTDGITATPRL